MKKFLVNLLSLVTKNNIIILIILGVASFLRLYRIQDYLTFLGDEGRDVLVAYNILHGHLTLLGPTSSVGGFFLGPIYYYFMAPFLLLFNYNPVGPAVMVALFGIATVWLIYKFCKDLFNSKNWNYCCCFICGFTIGNFIFPFFLESKPLTVFLAFDFIYCL